MTVSKGDVQALTWVATRLREDTHGCARWDAQGTYSVISELIGQNLAETLHRVIGHALDPEARTPGAIKRPFVPKPADEPGRRQPAKAGEDCKRHPGEYVGSCRACAVQHLEAPTDPVLDDQDRSAGQALLAEIRARRGAPQAADPGRETSPRPGSVGRPETACAAPDYYRPTRDGICERCRAAAIAEDIDAGNAALIAQLHANERARAHTRPAPEPAGPARYFTGADYDPERVHAAQARAAQQRSNA